MVELLMRTLYKCLRFLERRLLVKETQKLLSWVEPPKRSYFIPVAGKCGISAVEARNVHVSGRVVVWDPVPDLTPSESWDRVRQWTGIGV